MANMGKKGQFYILTAIILMVVLWGALPTQGEETLVRTTFDGLRGNFIQEAPYVINYAISHDESVNETFRTFTEDFITFAKERQVDFGVAYIITGESQVLVGNYLDEDIKIEVYGIVESLAAGELGSYLRGDSLTVYLDETPYKYEFTGEPIQFKALFKQIS